MKCINCGQPMEVCTTQVVMGDLTCCGERNSRHSAYHREACLQKDHKNYICNNCGILAGRVKNEHN